LIFRYGRLKRPLFLLPLVGLLFVFCGGAAWHLFRVSGKVSGSAPDPEINRVGSPARESPVFQAPLSLPELSQAAFSGLLVPPSVGEVVAARGYRTALEKRRYLELLEAFGFRGQEALPLLRTALNDPDQEIRRAALRGLGRTETAEAENLLVVYAKDGVAIEESTEAALVLGQMKNPAVTGKLQGLLGQARDPVLREHLVDGLAGRPWEQTQVFFSGHLRNPNIAGEEKQNALAMLGMRDTAPAQFLTQALGDGQEEIIRAGAYQGLAWRNETAESKNIRRALALETDPGIRALAYEAWGNQQDGQRSEILADYRREIDAEVNLRALKAWARVYGQNSSSPDPFLAEAVTRLEQVAMTDRDPGERREALLALQATRSEVGREALKRIAEKNSLKRVRELARKMSLSGHTNGPSR
jgi:HEAT repeat protein